MSVTGKIKRKTHVKNVAAAQPGQGDVLYRALTPTSDIQNGQEYMAALDWALEQDDIRNIAISGPYGSGKSSVINTYIKTRKRQNVLPISLAAFNLEDMHTSGENIDDDLETGILKQLFYHVRADKIPKSRYRKIQPEKWVANALFAALGELFLLILLYFALPNQMQTFTASISNLSGVFRIVAIIIVLAIIWVACFAAVRWFRKNGSVQEIKILDKATLKNGDKDDNESVFNKNLDEIIYFFEETDYRVVVIEDLDRFESTNIFVALRELNNLLNHYEGISEKVTFIYAIKDDMFQKEGERTKFFDFIVPIVPYISSSNSGEILRDRLHFDDQKNESSLYEISGQYISLISPYISDMRDLECICNEFIVFKNTLKGNQHLDLNDQRMFSLSVFKNLFPKDFAQLEDETDDSIVRCAFNDRKRFIAEKEDRLKEKREEQEEIIRKVEQEVFSDSRDIKVALLMCLMDYNGWVRNITEGNNNYSYADLLKDDFDFDTLKKKQLSVHYASYLSGTSYQNISDIEAQVIKKGGDYFDRLDRVKKGLDVCREDAKKEIEEYERTMNELRTYSIQKIISEFGTEFLSEEVKENDLLVFLLRNGFIDENYANYINYFHPNSISKDEMNFILAVRNHRSEMDYTYPLKSVSQIYDRLQDYEFQQKEALNYNLTDYVLEKRRGSSAEGYLISQLTNHSVSSMSFIKSYIERGRNIERLIQLLCHGNDHFWVDVCKDTGISLETRFVYLGLILSYASTDDIVAQDKAESNEDALTDFFLSNPDVLEKMEGVPAEKQIQAIDALGLIFTDLETQNLNETIRQHIFDNSYYEINEAMLHRVVEWKNPELAEKLKSENYSIIRTIAYQPLTDYVHQEFDQYVSDIVLGIPSNTEEDIESVEDILERLSPDGIEQALSVIEKEKVVWNDINDCCKSGSEDDENYKQSIWTYLLVNERILCSWENVETYFGEYSGDDTWVAYVSNNIDALVNGAGKVEISAEVKEQLLFADLSDSVFRKFISGIYKEHYNDTLSKLNPMKIQVLIEEHALPFRKEYWDELSTVAADLRVLYAEVNNQDFVQSLDEIDLTVDEVNNMLESDMFDSDQKDSILKKLVPAEMTIETARILRLLTRPVPKEYIDRAWRLLPDDEKYQLFLNQMEVYANSELPVLFGQLSPEYQQFVERTRHKYTLGYSDYNKALLDKLKTHDYITSVEDTYIEKSDKLTFSSKKEHVLTGYVKNAR
ncbi:hypothetical protein CXIVA_18430 [Clostridium sp. SY8519]|uniref:YobI family P-loop NTPase n=1 Tax=Clostridium sp. (strain SY8519) TaxID=1042156 RepID=UPI0002171ECC|nr:hypothetical protein [Clostridium sp. SY8519]BAK47810.1 hypothetical protein CXIVA_18430 [Clostridium sp. SY8519]